MKYEIYMIACGIETLVRQTDSYKAACVAYQSIAARGGYARVRIDAKTLRICEADRLMGRKQAGMTV